MSNEIVPVTPSGECPCKYKKNGVGAFVRDSAPVNVRVAPEDPGHPSSLYEQFSSQFASALRASGQAGDSSMPLPMGTTDAEILRQAELLRSRPAPSSPSWPIVLAVALAIAGALYYFARRKV